MMCSDVFGGGEGATTTTASSSSSSIICRNTGICILSASELHGTPSAIDQT